jgi:hypothetical protein
VWCPPPKESANKAIVDEEEGRDGLGDVQEEAERMVPSLRQQSPGRRRKLHEGHWHREDGDVNVAARRDA